MAEPVSLDPPIDGGVVVGYDGSGDGFEALRWAWQDARVHDRTLHVVRAWTVSSAIGEVHAPAGVVPSFAECAAAVRADTLRALDDVRRERGVESEPKAHVHVIHGRAGDALTAAAERADLVVVGHRGHNVFSLVLGSVAQHVLEHARCPVVVLPCG